MNILETNGHCGRFTYMLALVLMLPFIPSRGQHFSVSGGLRAKLMHGLLNNPFLEEQRKIAAWNNATPGMDPQFRLDAFGTWIKWSEYGDRTAAFGWEIDHSVPRAVGGSDAFANLRALHWRHNASLGGKLAGLLRRGA